LLATLGAFASDLLSGAAIALSIYLTAKEKK
jgi:hypothetical protein